MAESAASLGAPSRSHRRQPSQRLPLKGPSPGLCHGFLPRESLPYLPSLNLGLGERVGTVVAPAESVPSRGKFISGAGARYSSIHSLPAGVGVGVTRVRRESPQFVVCGVRRSVCLFVPSLEVRPGSQRACGRESASERVPAAPPAGARRSGPCSGGRSGAPSGGSAPCEAAGDAPATVNSRPPGHAQSGTRLALRALDKHRVGQAASAAKAAQHGPGRPAGAAQCTYSA